MSEIEIIYEELDFCDKCDGVEDVGSWYLPNPDVTFRICRNCYENTDLGEWFKQQLKDFLEDSPDHEKLPNGKYVYVGD